MTYYKVPAALDQKRIINPKKKIWNDFRLIENELYTEGECKQRGIRKEWLEKVTIKKTKTYWFFGARFCE